MGEAKRRKQYVERCRRELIELDKRFTVDGTEISLKDISSNGVMIFCNHVMFFSEGRLAEKFYYPTFLECETLYPGVPYHMCKKIADFYNVSLPQNLTEFDNNIIVESGGITKTDLLNGVNKNTITYIFWRWVHDNKLPILSVDCVWEMLRLLSRNVLAVFYCSPTKRPREKRIKF